MNATDFAKAHRGEFVAELKDLLRIPSISTLPENAADVKRCAEWVANQLRNIGLSSVEIYPTAGHPIVFGAWTGAAGGPRGFIFVPYSVQAVHPGFECKN